MQVKQYEIWLADLNPALGTEPGKIRPVIVIQTDLLNKHHPSVIVCPLTTNVQMNSEILRVHLKQTNSGLSQNCDIMADQIRAIDGKRLISRVGTAPAEVVARLRENIKIILDLD